MSPFCPRCALSPLITSDHRNYVRIGVYFRTSDSRKIRRYRCRTCVHSFSNATFSARFNQKKRRLNHPLKELLASGVSQRRCARNLKTSRSTVARKLRFLGRQSAEELRRENAKNPPAEEIQFDDMESVEATKLKPVSMTIVVTKDRRVMALGVASMPAKGELAARARKKYGRRLDDRKRVRENVFNDVVAYVDPHASITADQNPHYPPSVRKYFPRARFHAVKSRRARAHGFGELKKGADDPIWSFNHTAASFRGNTSALIRRTWCISKKRECLEAHMFIYAAYHNEWIRKAAAKKEKRIKKAGRR